MQGETEISSKTLHLLPASARDTAWCARAATEVARSYITCCAFDITLPASGKRLPASDLPRALPAAAGVRSITDQSSSLNRVYLRSRHEISIEHQVMKLCRLVGSEPRFPPLWRGGEASCSCSAGPSHEAQSRAADQPISLRYPIVKLGEGEDQTCEVVPTLAMREDQGSALWRAVYQTSSNGLSTTRADVSQPASLSRQHCLAHNIWPEVVCDSL